MSATLTASDCDKLEKRLIRNVHAQFVRGNRKWKGRPLWSFVIDVIGSGSTVACDTCTKHGWNPHRDASLPLPLTQTP